MQTETHSHACTVCGEDITAARLKAKPNARQCVPCLTSQGDVPLTKLHSELTPDGTAVQTLYLEGSDTESLIRDSRGKPLSDWGLTVAEGTHTLTTHFEPGLVEALTASSLELESLTEAEVSEIRDDFAAGWPLPSIAEKYGVSIATVERVVGFETLEEYA